MTHHVFYDTETTGPEPTFDQVLQAAAILVDDDFQELETIDIRSRLAPHVIPTAGALKVTHVDPYEIARAKYSAYEFACLVHETFVNWSANGDTAFAGFNTIRYDEEIQRQMFWQNLLDPYITSGAKRMRTDYLTTVRCLHARNPDVIEFPVIPETGKKSFKLERIAPANGFTGHDAHDALGDVRATIFVAQLIRDIDPALYEHMLRMGNANVAKEFADNEVVFQMLGGPMLDPGVLDVCLIGTERTNPKNKSAWNLAFDPMPYLDMTPEQILAEMTKKGTPFRTVKCNKQPGIFPMNWGFNHRVSTEEFEPADPATIDERVELIRNHQGFQAAVSEALSLRTESYGTPEHLEQKIYQGFPSYKDKAKMGDFHLKPDWASKLMKSREIENAESRRLGLRLVFNHAPEVLDPKLRADIDNRLAIERFTLETDRPWNTVGKLMQELDEMLAESPEDEELLNIRKWAIETYPIASGWEAHREALAAKAASNETVVDSNQEAVDSQAVEEAPTSPCASGSVAMREEQQPAAPSALNGRQVAAAAVHFLDGLD